MSVLETARLRLRACEAADAPFILALLNDPGFLANIGDRGVRTLEDADGYIRERVQTQYAAHGFGMWLVLNRMDDQPLGLAGLVRREGLEHPDVGYAFLQRASGRGYATEATQAVLRHARQVLGLDRIDAIVAPHNHASMAVLAKAGLRPLGDVLLPGNAAPIRHFTTETAA